MGKIDINNLEFSYDKYHLILSNLSVEIQNNKITTILGLNGCGKSTFVKLISGLLKSKENMIMINNKDIIQYDYSSLSRELSFVTQLNDNFIEYTVCDYLEFSYANQTKFFNIPPMELKDNILKVLCKFKLENTYNKKICELSGGTKQLIMICAALLQNTDIIILDEPTSALDIKNQYIVLSTLIELNNQGKTIVLTTHNPNHCLFLDSYTLVLKDGNIKLKGNAKDVIKPNILKEIYGSKICYSNDIGDYDEVSFNR